MFSLPKFLGPTNKHKVNNHVLHHISPNSPNLKHHRHHHQSPPQRRNSLAQRYPGSELVDLGRVAWVALA